jgi:DNA polymerase I
MLALLVDGSNLAYKSFHAMRNLQSSTGEHTGAVYGMLNSIYRLLRKTTPDVFVVVWDFGKSEWRTRLYPEYKAHRHDKTPEEEETYADCQQQIREIRKGLDFLCVNQVGIHGVEADDLIGIIVRRIVRELPNYKTVIASSDKDFYQLLRPSVRILRDWRSRLDMMTMTRFITEYGFDPVLWPDMLALMGDKDEIPGVKGIGEKHAQDLVQRFDTIQDMLKAPNKNGFAFDRYLAAVQANHEKVLLYKRLAMVSRSSEIFRLEVRQKIDHAVHRALWSRTKKVDKIGFQKFVFEKDMMSVYRMKESWFKLFGGKYV